MYKFFVTEGLTTQAAKRILMAVGVDPDKDDLKVAKKKLAMKFHPDRPGGDEEKMKEVLGAIEVLLHGTGKAPSSKPFTWDDFDDFSSSEGGTGGWGGGERGVHKTAAWIHPQRPEGEVLSAKAKTFVDMILRYSKTSPQFIPDTFLNLDKIPKEAVFFAVKGSGDNYVIVADPFARESFLGFAYIDTLGWDTVTDWLSGAPKDAGRMGAGSLTKEDFIKLVIQIWGIPKSIAEEQILEVKRGSNPTKGGIPYSTIKDAVFAINVEQIGGSKQMRDPFDAGDYANWTRLQNALDRLYPGFAWEAWNASWLYIYYDHLLFKMNNKKG